MIIFINISSNKEFNLKSAYSIQRGVPYYFLEGWGRFFYTYLVVV